MAIRKLTLATAISLGMFAVAIPASYADTVAPDAVTPTENQVVTPVADQSVVTDNTLADSCNTCPQPLPVVTGPACGTETPCGPCGSAAPVDPRAIEATGSACPCAVPAPSPACGCNPCDPCAKPASSVCPNVAKNAKLDELQVYAYPSQLYGSNQAYQAAGDVISFGNSTGIGVSRDVNTATASIIGAQMGAAAQLPCGPCGTTGSAATIPFNNYAYGYTGSALPLSGFPTQASTCGCASPVASIPCPCNPCAAGAPISGVDVSRNPLGFEGATTPIAISTCHSMDVVKIVDVPVQIPTGAAAPLVGSSFCDVPDGFWANQSISKLVSENVIVGYPDRTFKPALPVSRAEFATVMIQGLKLQGEKVNCGQLFCDVPNNFWGNSNIGKAVSHGIVAGYPDNTFHPNDPVSRAEALVAISKALCGQLDKCDTEQILSQYKDGCKVPGWARAQVAQAIKSGALANSPSPDYILPNNDASRADIAGMVSQMRIALGFDCPTTACAAPTGCAASVKQQQIVSLPTLQVKMIDEISSRISHVGESFYATSLEPITIDCLKFEPGSKLKGKIVDILQPDSKSNGAMRIAFTEIQNGTMKAQLPRQILCAQVKDQHYPNPIARVAASPFTWTGRILGNVGRTLGGATIITGNALEQISNDVGIATSETFQGQFRAAGRSIGQSVVALAKAPVDVVRLGLNGTGSLFNITTDELSYVVNPDGKPIASINPNEKLNVAFGCQ